MSEENVEVRKLSLVEELTIEGAAVPRRRGELYRLAAERIALLEAERAQLHESLAQCVNDRKTEIAGRQEMQDGSMFLVDQMSRALTALFKEGQHVGIVLDGVINNLNNRGLDRSAISTLKTIRRQLTQAEIVLREPNGN